MPAATAAADPPEEPPGTQRTSCGFRVGPNALFSVDEPIANSSMFVLATINAPLARSLFTAVASNGLLYPARILEAQVVGSPSDAMLSLIATGTPARTTRVFPSSMAEPGRPGARVYRRHRPPPLVARPRCQPETEPPCARGSHSILLSVRQRARGRPRVGRGRRCAAHLHV